MNLDGIIEDYPNTSTPQNKATFTNLANAILNVAFPVGKTEIFYDNDDHSNYMGFTWERTAIGKVPVGIDTNDADFNEIGKVCGDKTHRLTIAEMPKHSHSVAIESGTGNNYVAGSFAAGKAPLYYIPTNEQGGNQPHNNIQPSMVFAFWKRVE